MKESYSPWNRYRVLDACYRLQILQDRVEWDIFVEADCLQAVEAYEGVGGIIDPTHIMEDVDRTLMEGEIPLFLELRGAMDDLLRLGPVELDGPLALTLTFMRSNPWLRVIVAGQRLLNAMFENGVPGLVAWWTDAEREHARVKPCESTD